jgi:hypothetical protein
LFFFASLRPSYCAHLFLTKSKTKAAPSGL